MFYTGQLASYITKPALISNGMTSQILKYQHANLIKIENIQWPTVIYSVARGPHLPPYEMLGPASGPSQNFFWVVSKHLASGRKLRFMLKTVFQIENFSSDPKNSLQTEYCVSEWKLHCRSLLGYYHTKNSLWIALKISLRTHYIIPSYHIKRYFHIAWKNCFILQENLAPYSMKNTPQIVAENFVSYPTNNSLLIARTFSLISMISPQIASKMCHYIVRKIRFIWQE